MKRVSLIIIFCLHLSAVFSQKTTPLALWKEGNKYAQISPDKALKYYQESKKLAFQQKDYVWEANVCPDICGAYFALGQTQNAIAACEEGMGICAKRNIKVDTVLFKLYSSISPCYVSIYKTQEAIDYYEKANQLLINNPKIATQSPLFTAYYYSNYAYLLVNLFEVEKAEVLYENALKIAIKLPNAVHYSRILSGLSNIYAFTGEYQKGIEKYKEVIDLSSKQKQPFFETLSNSHYLLGYFYTKSKKYSDAIIQYQTVRKYARKVENKTFNYFAMATIDMCDVYLVNGREREVPNIVKSLKIAAGDVEAKYAQQLVLSRYYAKIGHFDKAIAHIDVAFKTIIPTQSALEIDPNKSWPHRLKLFEVLNLASDTHLKKYHKQKDLNDIKRAFLLKQKAIVMGSQIRKYQENVNSKIFFTDKYHKIFKDAIALGYEILLKTDGDKVLRNTLFNLAEESKSVLINDPLILSSRKRDAFSDSLLLKLQANQSYLSYLKGSENPSLEDIKIYEDKGIQLWSQMNSKNHNLALQISAQTRRQNINLPSKTAYLNYILLDNHLMVFIKTNTQEEIKRIKIDSLRFRQNALLLKQELVTPPEPFMGFKGDYLAEYFFDILIKNGFSKYLQFERLIVNPDNTFFDISFDILRNKITDKYLIETHAISYANSLEHSQKNSQENIFFIRKWLAFFPFSSTSKDLISGLKPLRFSTAEVKGIASQNLLDNNATKKSFLENLEKNEAPPILIATHASFEHNDPHLIFDEKNTPNSKLFVSEIRHYVVKSPLVILSACGTSQGKTFEGLGAMSFARALSWAGCPSVASTFWSVDDKSMSVLAGLFYENLLKGHAKDQALRLAKLKFLETDEGKANDTPFYWAHFQILGNTTPIVSVYIVWAPYIVALALTILILWIFRKRIRLFLKP